mmetsp:Transcript_22755/g.67805  ORF Transcript_22755/g.67805 Transcript_22755/m.67805 type:complete len:212 (+) Transcript_22755:371-1006(+)
MMVCMSSKRFFSCSSGSCAIVDCSALVALPSASASSGAAPPALMSSIALRYCCSRSSTSEATTWNADPMCSVQKASLSCRSYERARDPPPSTASLSETRFSRKPSRSCASEEYDQPCCSIAPTSSLRSTSSSSGRCSDAAAAPEKSDVCDRSCACSLAPSFSATAWAGPRREKRRTGTAPSVTRTEKRPEATSSTAASTSESVDLGERRAG